MKKLKKVNRLWFALAIIVVFSGGLSMRMLSRGDVARYLTNKVDRGDIRDVVEATGTINAVTTVQVGSQISGTIAALSADFNSHVTKGEIIAKIDDSLIAAALLQARADLETAKANAAAVRASLAKAKAGEAQARADYLRTKPLAEQGIISLQQLDVSKANEDVALASILAAEADIVQANAQVSQKAAAVTIAQTNLEHTIIRAPVDGVVVSRNVDSGQTVAASLQAPTLFTIARDLTKMQVFAKTDESDVGQIKTGQQVTFKVDAFPGERFQGHISQIRMNATTVQNVVTYDTVIDFDNAEMKLFPGMTAYVTIPVATAQDVLRVPNAALRFKPELKPDESRALYARNGINIGVSGAAGRRTGAGGQSGLEGGPNGAKPQQRKETRNINDIAVVWKVLPDNSLDPVQLRIGITDHATTEIMQVLKGQLHEGDQLITGTSSSSSSRANASPLGSSLRGK